eukprot:COSAG01_NODE_2666_length_7293_cov_6.078592_7_plen_116_part_00
MLQVPVEIDEISSRDQSNQQLFLDFPAFGFRLPPSFLARLAGAGDGPGCAERDGRGRGLLKAYAGEWPVSRRAATYTPGLARASRQRNDDGRTADAAAGRAATAVPAAEHSIRCG